MSEKGVEMSPGDENFGIKLHSDAGEFMDGALAQVFGENQKTYL